MTALVGSSLGNLLLWFCPRLSWDMGDSLWQRLSAGTASSTGEEEEEEEEKDAEEWPRQQGLPQARCSSRFLKRPQPLFQGLCYICHISENSENRGLWRRLKAAPSNASIKEGPH